MAEHTRPRTAAIYARVSTADQNTDLQLAELREYAARAGWTVTEYQEKESSIKHRPALERLMRDAQMRKFDVVLVWKIDRFARSTKQFTDYVLELHRNGVRFIAATQGIDTDQQSPAGKLMMDILAAFAEFERSMIVERVRAGVAAAKRRGQHCGRPKKIFRRDHALELRRQGKSLRAIAAALGVSAPTVAEALKGRL